MPTDVSTSHVGTEDPVRLPEPSSSLSVPALATSPPVVEPARSRRATEASARVAEPTQAGHAARETASGAGAGRASKIGERTEEHRPTADLSWPPGADGASSALADLETEPAGEATGDSWALFPGEADDPVTKPKRPARQHRVRTFVVMTVVLAMVVGVGYIVVTSFNFFGGGSGVSDYAGEGDGAVDVTVRSGDSGTAIAKTLHEADVIATEKAFIDACRASSDCQSIQPGTYTLKTRMSAAAALAALLNPDNRKSGRVTIPEGLTAAQIVERVSTSTGLPLADLNAAIADPASLGLPAGVAGVEGWLYATTYDVDPDATAAEVLTMMVDKTKEVLTAKQVPQDQWQTVLTKASIIEEEAGRAEDRPLMARAIENRLASGMLLQIDATVEYGAGRSVADMTGDEWIAARTDTTNPYNTYVHSGLPPGPIASPGASSIDAVLAPAEGGWVFWLTVNPVTKETKFAVDYEGHNANLAELQAWRDANQQATQEP